MLEEWRRLVYPNLDDRDNHYSISSFGRLRNDKTGRILKPSVLSSGYYSVRVTLGRRSKKIHIIIHKAVAYTYFQNNDGYREVNHIDSNRLNNSVENLEWCTSSHNQQHKYDCGFFDRKKISGENNHNAKLTIDAVDDIRKNCVRGSRSDGVRAFARKYNVSHVTIMRILNGRAWHVASDNVA